MIWNHFKQVKPKNLQMCFFGIIEGSEYENAVKKSLKSRLGQSHAVCIIYGNLFIDFKVFSKY